MLKKNRAWAVTQQRASQSTQQGWTYVKKACMLLCLCLCFVALS